jgi:hypothetical protein
MDSKNKNNGLGILKPPCDNTINNSSENLETINENTEFVVADFTLDERYTCPLIENLKHKGLYERFCNFVRTVRASTNCKAETDEARQTSDNELCRLIRNNFGFGIYSFSARELKYSLFSYTEFHRAYMAGQVELKTVLQETIIRKLEKADTTENIELGIKYMDTLAKIEQSNIKKQNGVVFNISDVSNDTKSTVANLMNSLAELNTSELEERGEDEEVLEYEQMKGDN